MKQLLVYNKYLHYICTMVVFAKNVQIYSILKCKSV